ncbi:MAG TPA: zf-HC2 domain-containing protein [Thermoanaerobaculia bacterium]|nr:zf-HC2 domain-containing protein [Thermoanaerobaculia bacterium]
MAPDEGGDREHGEVLELLPWYVNGSLEGRDRTRVETHLEGCPLCRAELAECRDLAAVVRNAPPPTPAPHPGSLGRLLARLDATETEPSLFGSGRRRLGDRRQGRETLARAWAAAPRLWRWVALGQTAALVLLGAMLVWRPGPAPATTFRTLSTAASEVPRAALRVAFSEEVTEGELRRLLLPLSAQIVAGPSPLGVYTLHVPAGASAEPLPLVVEHLSGQPGVRFVAVVPPGAE